MIKLNLCLFGGRGGAAASKYTAKQLGGMSRAQLVNAARKVYVSRGGGMGLSRTEAGKRFDALQDGNSMAQLRKYILRNQ